MVNYTDVNSTCAVIAVRSGRGTFAALCIYLISKGGLELVDVGGHIVNGRMDLWTAIWLV
jgi:predicted sugar kinase